MNYTNNIDKYYIHAHYNSVREKETNRNKVLWLLLLIGILLSGLFFLYKAYQFNEMTNVYTKNESEKSKVENASTTRIVESNVIASKETSSKKEKTTSLVASSAINTAIEKLEIVESQKLTDSTRESVLSSKINEKQKKMGLAKENSVKVINETSKTSLDQSVLASGATLGLDSTLTTPIAKVSDVNLSKVLPMETFHLYVISKGETLYSIAKSQYNDRGMYQKIIEANPDLENPNSIHEGQEILLPIVDEQKSYSDILHFK